MPLSLLAADDVGAMALAALIVSALFALTGFLAWICSR